MILWTIQPITVWNKLKKEKRLISNLTGIKKYKTFDNDFKRSYLWMIEQMKQRLQNLPPSPSTYPIWAWYQWSDIEKKVPDLRYYRHQVNNQHARIEFEIDDKLVLLSDYENWHFVLNDWIIRPEKDWDTEDKEIPFTEEEKVKSWDNVFDLEFLGPVNKQSIQATFWELKLEQVKNVKEFGKISKELNL